MPRRVISHSAWRERRKSMVGLQFSPRQVLHLLVQELRVPADVEGPFSQLAPVVHRLHPPVRRGVLGLRLVVFEALDLGGRIVLPRRSTRLKSRHLCIS